MTISGMGMLGSIISSETSRGTTTRTTTSCLRIFAPLTLAARACLAGLPPLQGIDVFDLRRGFSLPNRLEPIYPTKPMSWCYRGNVASAADVLAVLVNPFRFSTRTSFDVAARRVDGVVESYASVGMRSYHRN